MNFIRNRNFRAGPQTSLEGFICPQNSDKQQKIKVFGRSGGAIEIGNRCRMSNVAICSFMKVRIEDDVYIGGDVRIYDTDFHSLDFSNRVSPVDNNIKSLPVLIKHGAFIGASSIILKGVTVGEYSIIGAGSVVTKNIPNGEIWAGNPAKFLKKVE